MHLGKKGGSREAVQRREAEDLRGIGAALRAARVRVPLKGHRLPRRQRLAQSRLALFEGSLVAALLGEHRGQDQRSQFDCQQGPLCGSHPAAQRYAGVSQSTNAEGDCPDHCRGDDGNRGGRKHRAAAGRRPKQQRHEQCRRQDRHPVLRWRGETDGANGGKDDERRETLRSARCARAVRA